MYAASKGKKPDAVVPKGQAQAGAAAPQKPLVTDPLKNYSKLKR